MTSSPLTLQTKFALDVFILDAQARNLSPRTVRFNRKQSKKSCSASSIGIMRWAWSCWPSP